MCDNRRCTCRARECPQLEHCTLRGYELTLQLDLADGNAQSSSRGEAARPQARWIGGRSARIGVKIIVAGSASAEARVKLGQAKCSWCRISTFQLAWGSAKQELLLPVRPRRRISRGIHLLAWLRLVKSNCRTKVDACDMHYPAPESSLGGTSICGSNHVTLHGNVLDLCTALSRASHCFIKLMGTFWARWNADGSWEHLATCTCALPSVNLLHQTQDSCFPIYSILFVPESACRPRRYRNCL